MRNIIIVECISTGINFIEDIIYRGYNPVVLHLKVPDTEEGKHYENFVYGHYDRIDYDFDMIYEKDTYEKTLEEVKKYDPLLILPGNEKGVILATKLSNDLNLLCNSIENLDAMTLKSEMHKRLAENGLRSIKGKVVYSLDEALEFYDGEGLKEVVIKPIYSAGAAAVRICMDRDELISAYEVSSGGVNYFGEKVDKVLIQERINGVEYIVNTVSHKGIPRVTLVWKYNKITDSNGAVICDSSETVNELSFGEAEMVEYAYKVAKAIGIEYGPVHGEYMIDEKGPVLIEVNCRPCGANMGIEFLDRISGQHETDSILDAYLKPERFYEQLKKRYQLYAHGIVKLFIAPEDIFASSVPFINLGYNLKSYHSTSLTNTEFDEMHFKKTEDLETAAGYTYLVNEKKSQIYDDLEFLRGMEKNAFSLILSNDSFVADLKDDETYINEIKPLIEKGTRYGTGLLVTDQFVDNIDTFQINNDKIHELNGNFDFIIVNLNKSLVGETEANKAKMILDIFSKIKVGGVILIPKNTYQFLISGRSGMEALIKVLGYKVELPPYDVEEVIIASKR
ncbi:ATP-grasp domain-containing protein [Methanobrevibacter sp.]|uniref:ATP-grasp domain-containing protein n=1 Tax=Methanobrevibacter sp. TaxID=66852 RepID=UPI00388CF7BB